MQISLEDLFLSTGIYGLLGVVAVVIVGFMVTKKYRELGIFFIILNSVMIYQYLTLTNYELYYWHAVILVFGVIVCLGNMLKS